MNIVYKKHLILMIDVKCGYIFSFYLWSLKYCQAEILDS